MASPTNAITRYDLSLRFSEFSEELARRGFIGMQVLPPITVAEQSAKALKMPLEAILMAVEDTLRAPKAGYREDDFKWEEFSYATEDHGVTEIVDDRQIRMYGSILQAEVVNRNRAVQRVALAYEAGVAAKVFDTSTWAGAALTTALANGARWSVKPDADPVADIDAAKEKVIDSCGHPANALIMSDYTWLKLIRTDRIEELVKYNGAMDPTEIRRANAQLADLFDVEKIIVSRAGVKNSGSTENPAIGRIWDKTMVMVCRIQDDEVESMTPSIGRTLMWEGDGPGAPGSDDGAIPVLVEEYREEGRRGGAIRARTDYQQLILYPQAGHLLTNVVA